MTRVFDMEMASIISLMAASGTQGNVFFSALISEDYDREVYF